MEARARGAEEALREGRPRAAGRGRAEAALEAAEGLIGEAEQRRRRREGGGGTREEPARRLREGGRAPGTLLRSAAPSSNLSSRRLATPRVLDAAELARARRVAADARRPRRGAEGARATGLPRRSRRRRAEAAEGAVEDGGDARARRRCSGARRFSACRTRRRRRRLADAVVRLEREVATAAGDGGDARAELAAARAPGPTPRRASGRGGGCGCANEQIAGGDRRGLGARAERKAELLTRERDSLERVVESYSAEAAKETRARLEGLRARTNPKPNPKTPKPPARPRDRRRSATGAPRLPPRVLLVSLEPRARGERAGTPTRARGARRRSAWRRSPRSNPRSPTPSAPSTPRRARRRVGSARLGEAARGRPALNGQQLPPRPCPESRLRTRAGPSASSRWSAASARRSGKPSRGSIASRSSGKNASERRPAERPRTRGTTLSAIAAGPGAGAFPPPGGVLQTGEFSTSSAAATPAGAPHPLLRQDAGAGVRLPSPRRPRRLPRGSPR